LVSAGSLGGAWLFLAILVELVVFPYQLSTAYRWLRERKRNRLVVLVDDAAALDDTERTAYVRRRIRRRLLRRALASFPVAVAVVIAGSLATLLAIHELEGGPAIVALVAGALTAVGAVFAIAVLMWRRWSDLLGSPIVMSGTIVTEPSSSTGPADESGDPELLGMDTLGELSAKRVQLDVTSAWRLARGGPTTHGLMLGLRSVDLVSGAHLGMPRSGSVVIACSARGRCIGRLGEFEPRGRHRRDC
jgi:hypothetical protein